MNPPVQRPEAGAARRPLRLLSAAVILGGCVAAVAALTLGSEDQDDYVFVGGSRGLLSRRSPDVAMGIKSGRWQCGIPDSREIARRRVQFPSLNNMKDNYYIIYTRSPKIKDWQPINIISGSEAAKTLKGFKENDIAKAVGADKLADYQTVRALGMNIYQQKDEIKKQALGMHPNLRFCKEEYQWGYKEILNNTEFNENPGPFMNKVNISLIPPEEELRNVLDEIGDAAGGATKQLTQASDNIKGFFSGMGGR